MPDNIESHKYGAELIYVIVNHGLGSKIVKSAKKHGISGGTITFGRGTVKSKIMEYLGLSDIRKEIVFLVADEDTAFNALEDLNSEFEFEKPNHGIAFTTAICNISGTKNVSLNNKKTSERGADDIMYRLITAIVDKGKAEEVIAAAEKAGSRGGTVINARGAGIHETSKVFSMEIEPEREIVLVLSETDVTDQIMTGISTSLEMDKPGNGIIYVQNVDKAYGIR